MSKNALKTLAAPAAVGPYAQGIAAGGTVYVSGQLPLDPATGQLAGPDAAAQARRSLQNVEAVLAAAGLTMADVAKTTVLLADIADFAAVNQVYAEFFAPPYPARAAFQVAALPMGARVEIEAIAIKT